MPSAANLSRRQFMAAPAASAAAQTFRKTATRPNFLFLIADDHAGYVLGAHGDKLARTPNLDRLASQGTRFANHFCNSPVCTPSRQSLLTGQLPHMAGVTRLATPLSESKTTLAKRFKQAGYATGVFGKMHFNQPGRAGLHGFDVCMTEREIQQGWLRDVRPTPLPESTRVKPPWKPFQDPARIWLNAEALPFGRKAGEMRSDYCVSQALKFLDEKKDSPFALWVSLQEPHSPFDFPLEDRADIRPEEFTPPRIGPEDAWQIPLIFRDLSENERRGIIAAYYASVRFLDRNLGKVLDRLQQLNLDDNTLVVYLADHGYSLGHHGRFEKHCGYDPAMHVPLILRWPGKVGENRTVSRLTEHVDVPATITNLMNLEPLPGAHGQDLFNGPERTAIFSEYLENEEVFLRTRRWKYIFCSGARERGDGYKTEKPLPGRYHRLYDLENDPGEFRDVAAQQPEVVRQMQSALLDRFRATHPDAAAEPGLLGREAALEYYVRPRDVTPGRG
jgi:choline-sulfatase